MVAELGASGADERCVDRGQRRGDRRQRSQRGSQLHEVARPGRAERDSRQHPLQVGHGPQRVAYRRVPVNERGDCRLALANRGVVLQRARQPAAQLARAHRRLCLVEDVDQRAVAAAGEAGRQLEVASRRRVDQQRILAPLEDQRKDVLERRTLGFLYVLQQRAGGADRQLVPGCADAEAGEIGDAELAREQPLGGGRLEVPGCALRGAAAWRQTGALGRQQFRRR